MPYLTNDERETIICFNEANKTASVFTYNRRMLRDLDKLATERPDDCQHIGGNGIGGHTYIVPKKWIKLRASRILTDEQKAAYAERACKMLKSKSSRDDT